MGARAAIQCKFYDPEHVVSKKDIDSFIAASSSEEFSRRLWVSTSLREWGANAEAQVQRLSPPLTRIGLADLRVRSRRPGPTPWPKRAWCT